MKSYDERDEIGYLDDNSGYHWHGGKWNYRRVELWAKERGLLGESAVEYYRDTKAQTLKLMEEVGELAHAVAYRDEQGLKDSIGDCAVVLIILAAQNGMKFEDCLNYAWDEIKNRQGKLEDGLFKKD
ncbi:MazG-like family protein [Marinobacter sp.]|uniref:MazG-like family protein n=1 Tax=Marinobacter sp. TaxID=50741 RepID=UPI002357B8D3